MQVSEFRKELQEAIITLEKIARRIDENIVADEKAAVDAALHNAAVAQARKELASGVTPSSAPATNVPHDNPVDFAPVEQSESEKLAQRQIDARRAVVKANEK